jgi:hypothetical protein
VAPPQQLRLGLRRRIQIQTSWAGKGQVSFAPKPIRNCSPRGLSDGKSKGEKRLEPAVSELEAEAQAHFLKAIEVAREQHAKSLELRAVMSLNRLFQKRLEQERVRHMLDDTYGWFTEGLETADLQQAQALRGAIR